MAGTISILGCGWLGYPLAQFLVARGFLVKGSTTTPEKLQKLKASGIESYLLKLSSSSDAIPGEDAFSFFDCDILIINIPPKVRSTSENYHPEQIKSLIHYLEIKKVKKIIYISATSIYPKTSSAIDENIALNIHNTGNKALFNAEQLLLEHRQWDLTILRCAGLLGYDRIPGKYYIGKVVHNGHVPVNYIHRDDVIRILGLLIKSNIWNKTYNLVTPLHPTRREVFLKNASDFNFDPPAFTVPDKENSDNWKLVLGEQLIKDLRYEYIYPDPLHFHYVN